MDFLLQGAGVFIYPLGLCSVIALYVILERLISLRISNVVPNELASSLLSGDLKKCDINGNSSLGRIVRFFYDNNPDSDELKSFARLEMIRLERGMFLLDASISAAPLLGLLGTVAGLVSVFSSESAPTQEAISRGVGLALSTTVLGLLIAIPAIVGSLFLYRKIDTLCARLDVCAERLVKMCGKK
ncbi:MotA/TolQ/ExbB proton channel family protein [Intestinicryptomonas porci]|uniref:MotA/TolQ/ExbB proton channel family protein n=1 Tax=Intestinicryptomonas porci TaxID=2926320 RepID=A0ABU4WFX2_9BACT|nr:MotA/TolQ/ExbB proton channel family protein [Opitutales bacterium CLA-KB-P66]